jgi:hypothetical protein
MTHANEQTGSAAGLDSSAALVRAESDHLDATVRALIRRLASVPGLEMKVSHRHGRLRRLIGDLPYINDLHRSSDPIQEVVLTVGLGTYRLRLEPGSIRCTREVTSLEPGRAGRASEHLPFAAWASDLFAEIERQNFVNHESMLALRQLVEQDTAQLEQDTAQ